MALPTKPTTAVPTWATNTNFATGLDAGLPTKVATTGGEEANGHERQKKPPARKINYLWYWWSRWIAWAEDALDDIEPRLTAAEADIVATDAVVTGHATELNSIYSGDITSPTFADVTNLDADPTIYQYNYHRVGDIVFCSLHFSANQTADATITSFQISVPAAPVNDFAVSEVRGSGSYIDGLAFYPLILNTAGSNKRVRVTWTSNSTATIQAHVSFSYAVNN